MNARGRIAQRLRNLLSAPDPRRRRASVAAHPGRLIVESLEARYLLSGEGLILPPPPPPPPTDSAQHQPIVVPAAQLASQIASAVVSIDAAAAAKKPVASQINEVIFVDPAVKDGQSLIQQALANRPEARAEVVVLDANSDGVQQISAWLKQHHDLTAVHVISHGDEAALQLGTTSLDARSIEDYATALDGWRTALARGADLLLYGCDVAASARGAAFVDRLAQLTGADVAASTDPTGAAALGGNWVLEDSAGVIDATVLQAPAYAGLLAINASTLTLNATLRTQMLAILEKVDAVGTTALNNALINNNLPGLGKSVNELIGLDSAAGAAKNITLFGMKAAAQSYFNTNGDSSTLSGLASALKGAFETVTNAMHTADSTQTWAVAVAPSIDPAAPEVVAGLNVKIDLTNWSKTGQTFNAVNGLTWTSDTLTSNANVHLDVDLGLSLGAANSVTESNAATFAFAGTGAAAQQRTADTASWFRFNNFVVSAELQNTVAAQPFALKAGIDARLVDSDNSDHLTRVTLTDFAALTGVDTAAKAASALHVDLIASVSGRPTSGNTGVFGVVDTNGVLTVSTFADVVLDTNSVGTNLKSVFTGAANLASQVDALATLGTVLPMADVSMAKLLMLSDGRTLGDVLAFRTPQNTTVLDDYLTTSGTHTLSGLLARIQQYLAGTGVYDGLEAVLPAYAAAAFMDIRNTSYAGTQLKLDLNLKLSRQFVSRFGFSDKLKGLGFDWLLGAGVNLTADVDYDTTWILDTATPSNSTIAVNTLAAQIRRTSSALDADAVLGALDARAVGSLSFETSKVALAFNAAAPTKIGDILSQTQINANSALTQQASSSGTPTVKAAADFDVVGSIGGVDFKTVVAQSATDATSNELVIAASGTPTTIAATYSTTVPTVDTLTTTNTTPTITGQSPLSSGQTLTVKLFSGTTQVGSTYTAGDGNLSYDYATHRWSLVIPAALSVGTYSVEATVQLLPHVAMQFGSGNTSLAATNAIDWSSVASNTLNVTISNFDALRKFASIDATTLSNMIGDLGTYLESLRDSGQFDALLPYTNLKLGQAIDFSAVMSELANQGLVNVLNSGVVASQAISPVLSGNLSFDLQFTRPGDSRTSIVTVTLLASETTSFKHINQLAQLIDQKIATSLGGLLAWTPGDGTVPTGPVAEVSEVVKGGMALGTGHASSEIQQVLLHASSGTFTLKVGADGMSSGPISVAATAIEVQHALESLPEIGSGNVLVTGLPKHYSIEFRGDKASRDMAALQVAFSADATRGGVFDVIPTALQLTDGKVWGRLNLQENVPGTFATLVVAPSAGVTVSSVADGSTTGTGDTATKVAAVQRVTIAFATDGSFTLSGKKTDGSSFTTAAISLALNGSWSDRIATALNTALVGGVAADGVTVAAVPSTVVAVNQGMQVFDITFGGKLVNGIAFDTLTAQLSDTVVSKPGVQAASFITRAAKVAVGDASAVGEMQRMVIGNVLSGAFSFGFTANGKSFESDVIQLSSATLAKDIQAALFALMRQINPSLSDPGSVTVTAVAGLATGNYAFDIAFAKQLLGTNVAQIIVNPVALTPLSDANAYGKLTLAGFSKDGQDLQQSAVTTFTTINELMDRFQQMVNSHLAGATFSINPRYDVATSSFLFDVKFLPAASAQSAAVAAPAIFGNISGLTVDATLDLATAALFEGTVGIDFSKLINFALSPSGAYTATLTGATAVSAPFVAGWSGTNLSLTLGADTYSGLNIPSAGLGKVYISATLLSAVQKVLDDQLVTGDLAKRGFTHVGDAVKAAWSTTGSGNDTKYFLQFVVNASVQKATVARNDALGFTAAVSATPQPTIAALPANGRVSGDMKFSLSIDDTAAVTVKVIYPGPPAVNPTSNNSSVDDLIADINAALDATTVDGYLGTGGLGFANLGQIVHAQVSDVGLQFVTLTRKVGSLAIGISKEDDATTTVLGFTDGQKARTNGADLFLQNVTLGGDWSASVHDQTANPNTTLLTPGAFSSGLLDLTFNQLATADYQGSYRFELRKDATENTTNNTDRLSLSADLIDPVSVQATQFGMGSTISTKSSQPVASTPVRSNGQLQHDVGLKVTIAGAGAGGTDLVLAVTVTAASTADNRNIRDLATDVDAAIHAAIVQAQGTDVYATTRRTNTHFVGDYGYVGEYVDTNPDATTTSYLEFFAPTVNQVPATLTVEERLLVANTITPLVFAQNTGSAGTGKSAPSASLVFGGLGITTPDSLKAAAAVTSGTTLTVAVTNLADVFAGTDPSTTVAIVPPMGLGSLTPLTEVNWADLVPDFANLSKLFGSLDGIGKYGELGRLLPLLGSSMSGIFDLGSKLDAIQATLAAMDGSLIGAISAAAAGTQLSATNVSASAAFNLSFDGDSPYTLTLAANTAGGRDGLVGELQKLLDGQDVVSGSVLDKQGFKKLGQAVTVELDRTTEQIKFVVRADVQNMTLSAAPDSKFVTQLGFLESASVKPASARVSLGNLQSVLAGAFGAIPGDVKLTFDSAGNALRVNVPYQISIDTNVPVDILFNDDFKSLLSAADQTKLAQLLGTINELKDANGTALMRLIGDFTFQFDFGIDLAKTSGGGNNAHFGKLFLYDHLTDAANTPALGDDSGTFATFSLTAAASNMAFDNNAGIMTLRVQGGSASVNASSSLLLDSGIKTSPAHATADRVYLADYGAIDGAAAATGAVQAVKDGLAAFRSDNFDVIFSGGNAVASLPMTIVVPDALGQLAMEKLDGFINPMPLGTLELNFSDLGASLRVAAAQRLHVSLATQSYESSAVTIAYGSKTTQTVNIAGSNATSGVVTLTDIRTAFSNAIATLLTGNTDSANLVDITGDRTNGFKIQLRGSLGTTYKNALTIQVTDGQSVLRGSYVSALDSATQTQTANGVRIPATVYQAQRLQFAVNGGTPVAIDIAASNALAGVVTDADIRSAMADAVFRAIMGRAPNPPAKDQPDESTWVSVTGTRQSGYDIVLSGDVAAAPAAATLSATVSDTTLNQTNASSGQGTIAGITVSPLAQSVYFNYLGKTTQLVSIANAGASSGLVTDSDIQTAFKNAVSTLLTGSVSSANQVKVTGDRSTGFSIELIPGANVLVNTGTALIPVLTLVESPSLHSTYTGAIAVTVYGNTVATTQGTYTRPAMPATVITSQVLEAAKPVITSTPGNGSGDASVPGAPADADNEAALKVVNTDPYSTASGGTGVSTTPAGATSAPAGSPTAPTMQPTANGKTLSYIVPNIEDLQTKLNTILQAANGNGLTCDPNQPVSGPLVMLLHDPATLVDSIDKVLDGVAVGVKAYVSVTTLPIISNQLQKAIDFLDDLRKNLTGSLKSALESTIEIYGGVDNALRMFLFHALTNDFNGDGIIDASDYFRTDAQGNVLTDPSTGLFIRRSSSEYNPYLNFIKDYNGDGIVSPDDIVVEYVIGQTQDLSHLAVPAGLTVNAFDGGQRAAWVTSGMNTPIASLAGNAVTTGATLTVQQVGYGDYKLGFTVDTKDGPQQFKSAVLNWNDTAAAIQSKLQSALGSAKIAYVAAGNSSAGLADTVTVTEDPAAPGSFAVAISGGALPGAFSVTDTCYTSNAGDVIIDSGLRAQVLNDATAAQKASFNDRLFMKSVLDQASAVQFRMDIGQTFTFGKDLSFDVGDIGLALKVSGGVRLDINWDFRLGFGIDLKEGFYLVGNMPSSAGIGQTTNLVNGIATPQLLKGKWTVVVDNSSADEHFSNLFAVGRDDLELYKAGNIHALLEHSQFNFYKSLITDELTISFDAYLRGTNQNTDDTLLEDTPFSAAAQYLLLSANVVDDWSGYLKDNTGAYWGDYSASNQNLWVQSVHQNLPRTDQTKWLEAVKDANSYDPVTNAYTYNLPAGYAAADGYTISYLPATGADPASQGSDKPAADLKGYVMLAGQHVLNPDLLTNFWTKGVKDGSSSNTTANAYTYNLPDSFKTAGYSIVYFDPSNFSGGGYTAPGKGLVGYVMKQGGNVHVLSTDTLPDDYSSAGNTIRYFAATDADPKDPGALEWSAGLKGYVMNGGEHVLIRAPNGQNVRSVSTPLGTELFKGNTGADGSRTQLHGEFSFNMIELFANSVYRDGRMTLAEWRAHDFKDKFERNWEVKAQVNLIAELGIGISAGSIGYLPSIHAGIHVFWGIKSNSEDDFKNHEAFNPQYDKLFLPKPSIWLTDVGLDLGTFISGFMTPVAKKIQEVVAPIKPVIDVLTAPIPGISNLMGRNYSIIDLASLFHGVPALDFIVALVRLLDIIDRLPTDTKNLIIPVTSVLVVSGDVKNKFNLSPVKGVLANINASSGVAGIPGEQTISLSQGMQNWGNAMKKPGNALKINVLDDPFGTTVNILLGKPADLITYTPRKLEIKKGFHASFPVFPPLFVGLGGEIKLQANLTLGFDTYGIQKAFKSGNVADVFDGFYVSDNVVNGVDLPEVILTTKLVAFAELNAYAIRGGVEGGLKMVGTLDFCDPNNDGKMRASEIIAALLNDPLDIVSMNLRGSAFVAAYVELFAIFDYVRVWEYTFFDVTLFTWSHNPCDKQPVLASMDGSVMSLNTGSTEVAIDGNPPISHQASDRLRRNTTDGDETYILTGSGGSIHIKATLPNGQTYEQDYTGVSIVLGYAGNGNDKFDASALSIGVYFVAGAGNDELIGGSGNDVLVGSSQAGALATLRGNGGDDVLIARGGTTIMMGGDGNDTYRFLGDWGGAKLFEDVSTDGAGENTLDFSAQTVAVKVDDARRNAFQAANKSNKVTWLNTTAIDLVKGGAGKDILDFSGDDANLLVSVTGTNAGWVTASASGDNTVADFDKSSIQTNIGSFGFKFDGIENIIGGQGSDAFYIRNGAALTGSLRGDTSAGLYHDAKTGNENANARNTIDFSDYTVGVRVNQEGFSTFGSAGASNIVVRGMHNMFGGTGDDTLIGDNRNNLVVGNAGADLLEGRAGHDLLVADTFVTWNNESSPRTTRVDNYVDLEAVGIAGGFGSDGRRWIWLGQTLENKSLTARGQTLKGGDGNDILMGALGSDVFNIGGSGEGNDTIMADLGRISVDYQYRSALSAYTIGASGGNDTIYLGSGNNLVLAGAGDDTVTAADKAGSMNIILADNGRVQFRTTTINVSGINKTTFASTAVGNHLLDYIEAALDENGGTGGNDTVNLVSGSGIVIGGAGNDNITFTALSSTAANVRWVAGDHARIDTDTNGSVTQFQTTDTTTDTGGIDTISIGTKDDSSAHYLGANYVLGGMGADRILVSAAYDTSTQTISFGAAYSQDVIISDNGVISRPVGSSFLSSVVSTQVATGLGGDDLIAAANGDKVIVGGYGADTITIKTSSDSKRYIAGDNAELRFDTSGGLTDFFSTDVLDQTGGADVITLIDAASGSVLGENFIIGGMGNDKILVTGSIDPVSGKVRSGGATSEDVLIGDNGEIRRTAVTPTDSNNRMLKVASTVPDRGGSDIIATGNGGKVIIGGYGDDTIVAANGDNLVAGDNARFDYDTAAQNGILRQIETTDTVIGGADTITLEEGFKVVLGGSANDTINIIATGLGIAGSFSNTGANAVNSRDRRVTGIDRVTTLPATDAARSGRSGRYVVGDNALITFDIKGGLTGILTTDAISATGGNDAITLGAPDTTADLGYQVVFGGMGIDTITVRADSKSEDVIFGDNGEYLRKALDYQPISYTSLVADTGGDDSIVSGSGVKTVIGGFGNDTVNLNTVMVAGESTPSNRSLVLGDSGAINFDPSGTGRLRSVESTGLNFGGADSVTVGDGDVTFIGGYGTDALAVNSNQTAFRAAAGDNARFSYGVNPASPADLTDPSALTQMITLDATASTGDADRIRLGTVGSTSGQMGMALVMGGMGSDTLTVTGETANQVTIAGDNADISRSPGRAGMVTSFLSLRPEQGAGDTIETVAGNYLVVGGQGGDAIRAGSGNGVVFGDSGRATFTGGLLQFAASLGEAQGGNDRIELGSGAAADDGDKVVIGGYGADTISVVSVRGNGAVREREIAGDNATLNFNSTGHLIAFATLDPDPSTGGDDIISLSMAGDPLPGDPIYDYNVIAGGPGGDSIQVFGSARSHDVISGDNLDYRRCDDALTPPYADLFAEVLQPTNGGDDTIRTGAGFKLIFGGAGSDRIDTQTAAGDTNIVFGDAGSVSFDPNCSGRLMQLVSTATNVGGNDTINIGAGSDFAFGGFGSDAITINASDNVFRPVFGDSGQVDFDVNTNTMTMVQTTGSDAADPAATRDSLTLPSAGSNLVFGGTGIDTLVGSIGANHVRVPGSGSIANPASAGRVVSVVTLGEFGELGIVDPNLVKPASGTGGGGTSSGGGTGSGGGGTTPIDIGTSVNTGTVSEDGTLTATGRLVYPALTGGRATFVPQAARTGSFGTFSLQADGNWSYVLANSQPNVQALKTGDQRTETFVANTADGSSTTVNISISGKDDAASIAGVSTGAVTEDSSPLTLLTTGTLTVTSPDSGQVKFSLIVTPMTAVSGALAITENGAWTYTVPNAAVQSLGAGRTRDEVFRVSSLDGSASQLITITITGVNDTATIAGQPIAVSLTEDSNVDVAGNLTRSGSVVVTDVDDAEARFSTTVVSGAGALGNLSISERGDWTYRVANSAVQFLNSGETRSETFTVRSADGTASMDIAVTIMGVDEPVAANAAGGNQGTQNATGSPASAASLLQTSQTGNNGTSSTGSSNTGNNTNTNTNITGEGSGGSPYTGNNNAGNNTTSGSNNSASTPAGSPLSSGNNDGGLGANNKPADISGMPPIPYATAGQQGGFYTPPPPANTGVGPQNVTPGSLVGQSNLAAPNFEPTFSTGSNIGGESTPGSSGNIGPQTGSSPRTTNPEESPGPTASNSDRLDEMPGSAALVLPQGTDMQAGLDELQDIAPPAALLVADGEEVPAPAPRRSVLLPAFGAVALAATLGPERSRILWDAPVPQGNTRHANERAKAVKSAATVVQRRRAA